MHTLCATRTIIDMFSELIFVELLKHVNVAGVRLPAVSTDESGDNTELDQLEVNNYKQLTYTHVAISPSFWSWFSYNLPLYYI